MKINWNLYLPTIWISTCKISAGHLWM
jgi:hypothetical protein